jgi:hypothetical protein
LFWMTALFCRVWPSWPRDGSAAWSRGGHLGPRLSSLSQGKPVSILERLDQDHLHPLLEHPETNLSRPGIEPRPPTSQKCKGLLEQLMLLQFGTSTLLLFFIFYSYFYNWFATVICRLQPCPPRDYN